MMPKKSMPKGMKKMTDHGFAEPKFPKKVMKPAKGKSKMAAMPKVKMPAKKAVVAKKRS